MLFKIILGLLIAFLADRAISYYGAVLGLMGYITLKLGYQPDAEKVKQLRDEALARRIRELFGKR